MAKGKYVGTLKYKGKTVVGSRTFRTKGTANKSMVKAKARLIKGKPELSKHYKNLRITTREAIAKSVLRGKKVFVGIKGRKLLSKKSAKQYLTKK